MINKNLIANNYIQRNDLDKNLNSKIKKNFTKIFKQICNDILNNKKIFNIFEKSFHFNFNKKDLKKFNRFNTIAIIGMGGSILGAQAMHNFLKKKIKKKVFFFDNLYEEDILNLKKNFKSKNVLYIIISKSGNTIETISNLFSLSILKKRNRSLVSKGNKCKCLGIIMNSSAAPFVYKWFNFSKPNLEYGDKFD